VTLTSTDILFRKIAENPRAPQKVRIAALQGMIRPSKAFLTRLAGDPANPVKLRLLAAQRLDALMLMRARLKEKHGQGRSTQTDRT
jgi:hypothetical protein